VFEEMHQMKRVKKGVFDLTDLEEYQNLKTGHSYEYSIQKVKRLF